jgi:hypothetical protein
VLNESLRTLEGASRMVRQGRRESKRVLGTGCPGCQGLGPKQRLTGRSHDWPKGDCTALSRSACETACKIGFDLNSVQGIVRGNWLEPALVPPCPYAMINPFRYFQCIACNYSLGRLTSSTASFQGDSIVHQGHHLRTVSTESKNGLRISVPPTATASEKILSSSSKNLWPDCPPRP